VYETIGTTRSLKYLITEEGRVVKNGANWIWEYNQTDHLGDVRTVVRRNATTGLADLVQDNHYFPFGMLMSDISSSSTDNRFRYNGKEYQNDLGLEWYDYGARFYDPALARWHSVDPEAENYYNMSPYCYVGNNPISRIDPDGRTWVDRVVATVAGTVDNFTGANTRSLYPPTDPIEYNDQLDRTDKADQVGGALETVVGSTEAAGGLTLAPFTGGATLLYTVQGTVIATHGLYMSANASRNQAKGNNYGRQNETKVSSTRKEAKDSRFKPKPAQEGQKQVTHQSKNQSGEGNKMKTDGGKQTPHFHDTNHNNTKKPNVHYRTTKKIKP